MKEIHDRLVEACVGDNVIAIQKLESRGLDLTTSNNYILRVTCIRGHVKVLDYLNSKGIEIFDQDVLATMWWAAAYGQLGILKYLVASWKYNPTLLNDITNLINVSIANNHPKVTVYLRRLQNDPAMCT